MIAKIRPTRRQATTSTTTVATTIKVTERMTDLLNLEITMKLMPVVQMEKTSLKLVAVPVDLHLVLLSLVEVKVTHILK